MKRSNPRLVVVGEVSFMPSLVYDFSLADEREVLGGIVAHSPWRPRSPSSSNEADAAAAVFLGGDGEGALSRKKSAE